MFKFFSDAGYLFPQNQGSGFDFESNPTLYLCSKLKLFGFGFTLVFCFVDRPFSDDELRSNAPQVLTCNDLQREVAVSQNIAGKHTDRVFTFDKVTQSGVAQGAVYNLKSDT